MDNQSKLFAAIAEVFNVSPSTINLDSSPDTINGWDSLGMVNLVSELEQVFSISFDILEIVEMHNVAIIQTILIEKGIKFGS